MHTLKNWAQDLLAFVGLFGFLATVLFWLAVLAG